MSQENNANADQRLKDHIFKERRMKIICIGAGAAGLLVAYKLQRSFENFELVVYEKNEKVAGTWFENRYPGCACDVPAHQYTYSFEPKHDWSMVYAGSEEIFGYFEGFATKYELHKYIKFQHRVAGAVWNESAGGWDIRVQDEVTGSVLNDSCDILINAKGILNSWKWPDISRLHDFKGTLMHTANYDTSVDLTGKRVGLIGNGSSGIQVLPAIQPKVAKLTHFVRNPTWITGTFGFDQRAYTEEEIRKFKEDPEALLKYRKEFEATLHGLLPILTADSDAQAAMKEATVQLMKSKIQNPELEDKMIPKTFGLGCRRVTPGLAYLDAIGADNVELVPGDIDCVTEKGVLSTNGQEYPLDVLICATGFDTSFRPRFEVIGDEGKNLQDEWAVEPKSYLGMGAAGFPNYFLVLGPNSPAGNGPGMICIEAQIDYILKWASRWQTENIHKFSPKSEAVEDFIAFKDEYMKKMVWSHDCASWYKNKNGKVIGVWAGSTHSYLETIVDLRHDDWNVTYSGNRFAFLGNGISQTELTPSADLAYYFKNSDDSPYLSKAKRIKTLNKSIGKVEGR